MAGKGIIDMLTDPDVAIAEGVPAILGLTSGSVASASDYAALVAATAEASAISALQSWADGLTGYAWGLFDQSGNALFPDALVLQVGGNTPRIVSNAPVQNGSFTSYNKVANPEQVQIGLSFQGSISDKAAYFADLETLLNGTDLVTVRMPESTRLNMTVVNISYMRNARSGADLFMPVVTLQEIRVYARTTTTTKDGTTPTTQNMGSAQAATPTSAQSAKISS